MKLSQAWCAHHCLSVLEILSTIDAFTDVDIPCLLPMTPIADECNIALIRLRNMRQTIDCLPSTFSSERSQLLSDSLSNP
ncbi:hypothetical protein BX666DRAFT_1890085 [Dichotomocladium elegans]|nr:hypothetical protein BX666DRAFT_1890085 [Dichotomocladium elegans]